MSASNPGLGDPASSVQSIYGPLNSAGFSYRVGLQIAIVLLICNFVAVIVYIEYKYTKDFDEMMMQYKDKPEKLLAIFFCCYVIGCVILIPPSTVLIVCAYTFTHIWGLWLGCFYCFWFNLFCQQIAHYVTWLVGHYAFFDTIYPRMIRYKKFFVLNRALMKHGTYIHFLARVSFMVPHPVLSYALSVTDITTYQYIHGNWALAPVSIPYIYIGVSIRSLNEGIRDAKTSVWESAELYYFIVTMIFMIVIICYVFSIVKEEVAKYEEEFDRANPNFMVVTGLARKDHLQKGGEQAKI